MAYQAGISLPSGVNKGLSVKITLNFAAENILLISFVIFFSKQTNLSFICGIFKVYIPQSIFCDKGNLIIVLLNVLWFLDKYLCT